MTVARRPFCRRSSAALEKASVWIFSRTRRISEATTRLEFLLNTRGKDNQIKDEVDKWRESLRYHRWQINWFQETKIEELSYLYITSRKTCPPIWQNKNVFFINSWKHPHKYHVTFPHVSVWWPLSYHCPHHRHAFHFSWIIRGEKSVVLVELDG